MFSQNGCSAIWVSKRAIRFVGHTSPTWASRFGLRVCKGHTPSCKARSAILATTNGCRNSRPASVRPSKPLASAILWSLLKTTRQGFPPGFSRRSPSITSRQTTDLWWTPRTFVICIKNGFPHRDATLSSPVFLPRNPPFSRLAWPRSSSSCSHRSLTKRKLQGESDLLRAHHADWQASFTGRRPTAFRNVGTHRRKDVLRIYPQIPESVIWPPRFGFDGSIDDLNAQVGLRLLFS
jgi:hypothetical protein